MQFVSSLLKDKVSIALGWFNTKVCMVLPVVNFRESPQQIPVSKKVLLPAVFVQGQAGTQFTNSNRITPWIAILKRGFETMEVYAAPVEDGLLIGRGLLLNAQKKVLLESAFFQLEYLYKLRNAVLILQSFYKCPERQLNHIIPLINKLSNNYYHWTIESLTRIALLADKDENARFKYSLVIARDAPAFVEASLIHLLQWPAEKIIRWHHRAAASVKDCWLISYPVVRNQGTQMVYAYPPAIYRLLNRLAFKNIPATKKTLPKHFIVSRSGATFRKLLNEAAVQSLPNLSISLVQVEQLTFVEQVQLFQQAAFVIAPHGAGLTNLVYCNPRCVVIELCPQKEHYSQPALFYQIANALSLRYYLLEVPPANAENDMMVTDEILQYIEAIAEKTNENKKATANNV